MTLFLRTTLIKTFLKCDLMETARARTIASVVDNSKSDGGVKTRVLNFLTEKGGDGAQLREIAYHTDASPREIRPALRRLEEAGEVWCAGSSRYFSTDAFLGTLSDERVEKIVSRMKEELERAIFGISPPAWAKEFAAAVGLGLSEAEAWAFARRKLEANP